MSTVADRSAQDGGGDAFYSAMQPFHGFAKLMDPSLYRPVPDGWLIGVADIVQSTRAIADNRYKAVNMAGAAVIAAVTNALDNRDFPFAFGGDGASFAVAPQDEQRAREALAATATWVREDLDLSLRVALVPIEKIRAHGLDVLSRAMRRRRIFPTRCFPAAASPGRKPR